MPLRTDSKPRTFLVVREGILPVLRKVYPDDNTGLRILAKFAIEVKVDRRTGCWHWPLALTTKGYGRICWDGSHRYAHRWLYEQVTGEEVPRDLEMDHVYSRGCRYKDCVRPSHLEPVTKSENMQRAFQARKLRLAAIS